jgi:hypothetical protein
MKVTTVPWARRARTSPGEFASTTFEIATGALASAVNSLRSTKNVESFLTIPLDFE